MKNSSKSSKASAVEGNTISSTAQNEKPKQVSPAVKWCFTFNNYTDNDITILNSSFSSNCSKFIFENEIGEEGTPHLQGYIAFEKKRRPSELKLSKSIHWEKVKGTENDNILYCSKDFRNGVKGCKVWKSDNARIPRPLKVITELKPWQQQLKELLEQEPEDRKIIWIYENVGNVGKSAFSKYAVIKMDALYITEGKKSDIINIVYNYTKEKELDILILDVPRENGNKISYKSLEEIKNGLICNTKYETGNMVINAPHIVVFANEAPELYKFSMDRWEIYKIENDNLIEDSV